jgi:uncharacterized protein (TIGR02147 family)
LKDQFLARKRDAQGYSYARFSKLLGLSSPNHSQLILEGKRSLTLATAHLAADGLALNEDERQYLELLVIQDGIENPKHLRILKERGRRLQRNKPKSTMKISRAGDELNRWYMPALLVFFAGKSETTDVADASEATGINVKDVREGLEILIEKGLLTVRGGRYAEAPQVLWTDRKGINKAQKTYLVSQIEQSRIALDRGYDRGAKFGAHTITVSSSELALIADRFESLVESIIVENDRPENEQIVQINFQIFNLKHLGKSTTIR